MEKMLALSRSPKKLAASSNGETATAKGGAAAHAYRVLREEIQGSERVRSLSAVMNRALGRGMRRQNREGAPSQPRTMDPDAPTAPWTTGSVSPVEG